MRRVGSIEKYWKQNNNQQSTGPTSPIQWTQLRIYNNQPDMGDWGLGWQLAWILVMGRVRMFDFIVVIIFDNNCCWSTKHSTINHTSNNSLPTKPSWLIPIIQVLMLVDGEQHKCNNHLRTEDWWGVYTQLKQQSTIVYSVNTTIIEVYIKMN